MVTTQELLSRTIVVSMTFLHER